VPRKLDAKMSKSTNALHSDQISAAQAGIAKSVVGGDARAEERCGFCRTELVRNGSDAAGFSDHHFRISSIHGHSQYHGVLTIHDVPASARFAHPVFAADQADTDTLADFPSRHSGAQGFNAANDFMTRNARQSQTRIDARDRGGIGVTDSTCFHPNPNLTRSRLSDWPFHHAKFARCRDFYRFVCAFHQCVLSFVFRSRSTSIFFSFHPFANIWSAVVKLHAIRFTTREKVHYVAIDDANVFQI
jgi:hypothetical protein